MLVSGTRPINILAAGATSTGKTSVVLPGATPSGAYHVLACADDLLHVAETDEQNCRASTGTILVIFPESDRERVEQSAGEQVAGSDLHDLRIVRTTVRRSAARLRRPDITSRSIRRKTLATCCSREREKRPHARRRGHVDGQQDRSQSRRSPRQRPTTCWRVRTTCS